MTASDIPLAISDTVHALWEADATAHRLGATVVAGGPGSASVRLTVADDHANSHGVVSRRRDLHAGRHRHVVRVECPWRPAVGDRRGDRLRELRQVGDVLIATATEESLRGKAGIYDVRVMAGDLLVGTFRGRTLAVHEG